MHAAIWPLVRFGVQVARTLYEEWRRSRMGFDAGAVVQPLDWTFVKITKDDADQGTVPEPSDKEIDAHFKRITRAMRDLMKDAGIEDPAKGATQQDLLVAVADLPEDKDLDLDKFNDEITQAYADLCKGSPSLEQLQKLPRRIRLHFYAWLMGELRPNISGADSTSPPNLRIVKGA